MTLITPLSALAWVVFATVIGILPRRFHFRGAMVLLPTAPVVIGLLWWQYGWVPALIALLGAVSILRYPLMWLGRKAMGKA